MEELNKKKSIDSEFRYSILYISDHCFGVDVKHVKEVIPAPLITPVPNVHPSVLGVFNLRGQILSAVDIRYFLNLNQKETKSDKFVVLLEYNNIIIGIAVEKVMDVLELESSKIEIPNRELSAQFIQYAYGYIKNTKLGSIYLLDVPSLFETKEIKQYRY